MADYSVVFIQKRSVIPTEWIDNLVDNNFYFKVITNSDQIANLEVNPDVIVIDISHSITDKLDTISWVRNLFQNTEIIVLTTIELISIAVESVVSKGVFLYLPLPTNGKVLVEVIKKAIKANKNRAELISYESDYFEQSLNSSKVMEKVLSTVKKIAPTEASILITGESGTGKEVLSKYIHSKSSRASENFIAINCGAIPENLIESELFGHKKGSFTSADRDKKGLVEEADKGTLFLDEIGELPFNMQVKLLRFLQEKTFRKVGDTEERYSNVRVISATNKNLKQMVNEGSFREDLYYRINVFHIEVPPLRNRKESIPLLINNFLFKYNAMYNKSISLIDKPAMRSLADYNFPGNIRELENIIEHSVVLADGNSITIDNFPEHMIPIFDSSTSSKQLYLEHKDKLNSIDKEEFEIFSNEVKSLKDIEIDYIYNILDLCKGNHTEASRLLGISRATLWRKLKEKE